MRLRVALLLSSITALLYTGPDPVHAQVVRGRVLEVSTNEPIKLAALELLDDRQRVLARTSADSMGAFKLRGWLAGKYHVRASALGYQPVTSDVLEVGTGEEFELNVRLATDAIAIQPVTVVARSRSSLTEIALRGYYDRRDYGRRIGMGRFLDRGEIEERGTKLTDVLRRVPGFRILHAGACVIIAVAGNPMGTSPLSPIPTRSRDCPTPPGQEAQICRANVFLDGVQLQFDSSVSIDQLVPLQWVEAIEAYRRPAELPAEFLGSGACGVVAIWTRRGD